MPEGSLALLAFPVTPEPLQAQVSTCFSSTPANGEENPTSCYQSQLTLNTFPGRHGGIPGMPSAVVGGGLASLEG